MKSAVYAIVLLLILAAVLITVRIILQKPTPEIVAAQPQPSRPVYASWDTMEFDKCVSAWLIVRFIDHHARFVLHPQGTEITDGTIFDVPGAQWSRKHRQCTSDCVWNSLNLEDPVAETIVAMAHNVELNRWQLEQFPQAWKCFHDIRQITDASPDRVQSLKKAVEYFDNLYSKLEKPHQVNEEE